MCGIAGVFHYNRNREVAEDVLRDMASSLQHRGPDDEGFYRDERARLGFAFRRLSIVDLARGRQPMATEDGRYWLIFNGEIYNHLDIRSRLEAKGRRFLTNCDTEVILHTYAEYGPACVEHLDGMFAFAIWDSGQRSLFLARDRIGIKPVYYAMTGGSLVFGSEIKALFRHPDLNPRLNHDELARYLTFLCVPPPNTLFEGIHKLRAGHTLLIREGREPEGQTRYWTPFTKNTGPSSEADLTEELRETLTRSIRARLMADVPFGAFLSGGVDSSGIVSIMSRILGRPVETFSVGYKDNDEFNEFEYARQAARTFETNHHEVLIDHNDFRDFLPRLVEHQDEPIADPVCVPLYFVAKLARENGVVVTLVGEGSDELFFGYDFHNRIWKMVKRIWNPVSAFPRPVRSLLTHMAAPFLDVQRRDFLTRLRQGGEPFWGGAVAFYPEELKSLAPTLASDRRREEIIDKLYGEIDSRKPGADFPTRVTYLELMFRLPELLLMRVDKMAMAASVEGRVPFLDHRLVELAFRIPTDQKVKNGRTKHILKEALKDLLPPEILNRRKVGFHVPVTDWFGKVLSPLARDALLDPKLNRLEFWNPEVIHNILERQKTGSHNYGMRIWSLVNFALWYRHWIEGESF